MSIIPILGCLLETNLDILLCTTGLKHFTKMNRDLKKRHKELAKERAYLKARLELIEIDYNKTLREIRKDTSLSSDQYSSLIHEIMKVEGEGKLKAIQEYKK